MGQSGSKTCRPRRKDMNECMSVVTLTDTIVQRFPVDGENANPLEKEAREQSIEDFWKERMECMEAAYMKSLKLSEEEFDRMEKTILSMSPPIYKPKCPSNVEDLTTCALVYCGDPLKCSNVVKKFLLCIDSVAEDDARKACLNAERELRKKAKEAREARKKKCS